MLRLAVGAVALPIACYEGVDSLDAAAIDTAEDTSGESEATGAASDDPVRSVSAGADHAGGDQGGAVDDAGSLQTGTAAADVGCTNPTAANFDASVTTDDGSCIFPNVCSSWEVVEFDQEMASFGNDATQTLRGIVADNPTCTVVAFSKRTYRFKACAETDFCQRLDDDNRHLVFDGSRARFVIDDPTAGFIDIQESENVYFRNFSLVHDPYPFTQGRIVGVGQAATAEWIDVEVATDGSFRGFDDPAYDTDTDADSISDLLATSNRTWGNVFLPSGEMLTGVLEHSYKMGPGAMEVETTATTETWRIFPEWDGDFGAFLGAYAAAQGPLHWVTVAKGGSACFRVRRTPAGSRVVYDKLRIKTCPIQGFGMFDNDGTIEVLRSTVKPPTDALISTNGGVVLDHRHRAPLRLIRNRFEGVADDGVNIFSPERPIVADATGAPQIDCNAQTVLVHELTNGAVREGDVMQLAANHANDTAGKQYRGSLLARGVVTDVTSTSSGVLLEMSNGFWPHICQGNSFAFGPDFAAFSMFDENDGAPGSRILRNHFEIRGTGVHNIGVNSIIRGNTFVRGITGVSVGAQLRYENAHWASKPRVGPGPYPRGLIIDDNDFDGAGFGEPYSAPISPTKPNNVQLFLPACRVGTEATGVCNGPVTVEVTDNVFTNADVSSIQLWGGETTVTGNTFEGTGPAGYFPVNLTNAVVDYSNNLETGVASSTCHVDLSVYTPSKVNGNAATADCVW